ncbi:hypothetical protein [Bradyrhizobium sp. Bra64]|uniref:hypothetical protein n=1 Tax=Bradyrhizobium sp. Bra64 TaxID=2926009 RepID=UPI002117536E|nr:hypothetical protein [Bradyrhizobium sp. Bra64]
MVGGFPQRRPAPAKVVEVPTVSADDEDGRRRITAPLTPAPTRPPPSFARPLPPMPSAPRPGGLPPRPLAPVKPTTKREGPLPPLKAAPPAPTAVKRPPPPTYVRKPAPQYLDPESIPYDPPKRWR